MAAHMYSFVQQKMESMITAANFISMTCDETSGMDNKSYIAVHVYVMQIWSRSPLFVALQQVASDGATANGLTDLLLGILASKGGLDVVAVAKKLVCFGADGARTSNGCNYPIEGEVCPIHTRSTLHTTSCKFGSENSL